MGQGMECTVVVVGGAKMVLGEAVAYWLGRWTSGQGVASLIPNQ